MTPPHIRRLFVIPITENAYAARRPEEIQSTRLPLLQLALAAIHAHVPDQKRHILVIASQISPETSAYLYQARERGYIQDLLLSTIKIQHGTALDIATHHGVSRWHDVFYCQDMDVEIQSNAFVYGVENMLAGKAADFCYDSLNPLMHYGSQLVPPRPLCCMFAGSCAARARYPVSLEHIQGEIMGRDPSPLRLDRMWDECARRLRKSGSAWQPVQGRREFHTDTGYAFLQLAPLWGLKVKPLPDHLRECYVHRAYLSSRYGLSDRVVPHETPWLGPETGVHDGRTVAEHLDEVRTRLRELYGEEPA
jgi:hypothetical protein